METSLQAVRVQEVITSGSEYVIGDIRFNSLDEGKPSTTIGLPNAKPLFPWVKSLPTVNEIVFVLTGPKDNVGFPRYYYMSAINANKAVNHNALPNELTVEEVELEIETSTDDFTEIKGLRPLHPYPGDLYLEGRYGQSLRFGSTTSGSYFPNSWSNEGEQGDPITIINNGQAKEIGKASFEYTVENINEDNSSIYLCSNQQITNFQKAGISPKNHPASYKHML